MNQRKYNYASLAILLGILGTVQGRELRCTCPLHIERNPSFSMNTDSGLWQCFSKCGAGNFTQLVEKKLGYSRQEAERWINSNGQANSANILSDQLTSIFYPPVLASSNTGAEVGWLQEYEFYNRNTMPQWFFDRGFNWDTVNYWRLVYNIGTDAIIIPVFWDGKIVGTVTRNTNPALPKYKNSDLLPVEKIFFGEISRDRRDIILCEGILDAIWLWQLGFHGVSILGANLTAFQVQVLNVYRFGEITLAFDNDEAGRRATDNAVKNLMGAGWMLPQIKIIRFPGKTKAEPDYKKDPQDCSAELFGNLYAERTGVFSL